MNRAYKTAKGTASGFTLIELLVVLVILGLLAGLVGPQVMKYVGTSKTKTARLQLEDLGAALDLYRLEDADELHAIGFRDLAAEADLLLVEWAEKAQGAIPAPDMAIDISYSSTGRVVRFSKPVDLPE